MGRWQAVGEIQIRALFPEGYEDTGSLINALRTWRARAGASRNAATRAPDEPAFAGK